MEAKINSLSALVAPFAEADTEYFYSRGVWTRCLNEDLRPPDVFEGWMAGGQSPMLPWLRGEELSKVTQAFGVKDAWSLMMLKWKPEDQEKLKGCLSDKNYHIFLQNLYGPLESVQPPGQPGFGPNSLGLKPFINERIKSVRQQLSGERRSSSGRGAGNGGSMWISDFVKMF
jgi:hypothetical protein